MKITPVKNYKKPRYAALAMAAVTALAGCAEVQTEGTAPNPNDSLTTEVALDGDVAVVDTTVPESTITTTEEITTTTVPAGSVAIATEETTSTQEETEAATTTEATSVTTSVTTLQGTVTTVDDETDIAAEEIAEDDIVEVSTEGIVVAPEDTLTSETDKEEDFELEGDIAVIEDEGEPDEEDFELGGDVVVEEEVGIDGEISLPEDEEVFTEEGDVAVAGDDYYEYEDVPAAEEFSLAGDIAVVPDYNAYNEGAEYTDEYINIFREHGIFLAEKPGDEWGPYAVIFKDKPFILSLTGLRHDFYISFFNSEDKAFTDELKYHGMVNFEYGYYGVADVNNATCTILFIDVTSDHYNHINEIAEKMNSSGIPGENVEQKSIDIAYERIANNGFDVSNIVQAFKESGCELNAHTEGDYLIEYIGFELNKEVPLAFDSDTHKVYIMAYDSENPYDPISNGLSATDAPQTQYGSVLRDEFGYTYIFLDVSKFDEEGSYEIAAAAAIEELETK